MFLLRNQDITRMSAGLRILVIDLIRPILLKMVTMSKNSYFTPRYYQLQIVLTVWICTFCVVTSHLTQPYMGRRSSGLHIFTHTPLYFSSSLLLCLRILCSINTLWTLLTLTRYWILEQQTIQDIKREYFTTLTPTTTII